MNNETNVGIKFDTKVSNPDKIEKLAQNLATVKSVLKGFDVDSLKIIEQSADNIKDISKESKQGKESVKGMFDFGMIRKFNSSLNMAKRLLKEISTYMTASSDYLENLNLFQVAFEGNYKSATKFVNTMSEMYGLDESWGYKTVGIFKQLTNAMNLSTETGEKFSQLLTQMSLDISSLYNVDINRASSVLQSSLAGQTKPIRGIAGADITQATLQTTLDSLDIDRKIADLSFAEKRMVIIISLTQQLKESIGDMAKTIESPANQTRILHEQWNRLTRAVGNVFLPIISKVLPYVNAILMVLTEIANVIARLFGYKEEDYYFATGMSDSVLELEDSLGSVGDTADKTAGKVNKIKDALNGLRGFDKLNNLTTPTDSTGGAGGVSGGGGAGGISPDIMNAFNKAFDDYYKKLNDASMKATKIRDKILEWLGFTKEIDAETGKVSWKFDHITGGTVLGALAVGGTIYSGIHTIFRVLNKMGLIDFQIPALSSLISKMLKLKSITGVVTALVNFAEAIGGSFVSLVGVLGIFEGINELVSEFGNKVLGVEEIIMGLALVVGGIALIVGAWPVAAGAALVAIASLVAQYFTESKGKAKEVSKETEKAYKKIKDNLASVTKDYSKLKINKDMVINEKTAKEITTNINNLTKQITDNITKAKKKMISSINEMVTSGYLTTEEAESATKKTEEYYNNLATQTDNAKKKINEITARASKENRALTQEERDEITKAYDEIQKNTTLSLTTSEQEQKVIMQKIKDNNIKASKETASELIKEAVKQKEKAIKEAEEQYDGVLLQAQKMLDVGAINQEQYDKIAEDAKKSKDKTVKEAEETYDGVWKEFKKSNEDIADYIDKDTGKVKSNWTKFLEDMGDWASNKWKEITTDWDDFIRGIKWYFEKFVDWLDEKKHKFETDWHDFWTGIHWVVETGMGKVKDKITKTWDDIKSWWNKNVAKYFTKQYWQEKFDFSSIKIKTPHLSWTENGTKAKGIVKELLETLNLPTSLPRLNVSWYGSGGLPPVGQLFVANEKGPELVGQIGGQSFVANQNQMMELLDKKISSSSSDKPQTYNIYVGSEKVSTVVLKDLKGMAKTNGKPIEIKA